jgi:hypothetical protein
MKINIKYNTKKQIQKVFSTEKTKSLKKNLERVIQ